MSYINFLGRQQKMLLKGSDYDDFNDDDEDQVSEDDSRLSRSDDDSALKDTGVKLSTLAEQQR